MYIDSVIASYDAGTGKQSLDIYGEGFGDETNGPPTFSPAVPCTPSDWSDGWIRRPKSAGAFRMC